MDPKRGVGYLSRIRGTVTFVVRCYLSLRTQVSSRNVFSWLAQGHADPQRDNDSLFSALRSSGILHLVPHLKVCNESSFFDNGLRGRCHQYQLQGPFDQTNVLQATGVLW